MLDHDFSSDPLYKVIRKNGKIFIWGEGNFPDDLAYELREGKREYTLRLVVDIEDANLFLDLLRQGVYVASPNQVFRGFQIQMVFTRGTNDTITFLTPPTTPGAGGDAMGCLIKTGKIEIVDRPLVDQTLDILMRSLKVTVVDSVPVYP